MPKIVEVIYGRDAMHATKYLTRISIPWYTKVGRPMLHWFHRGDEDPAPHDHPWDFWTFPFTGYWEEVLDEHNCSSMRYVKPFRLHFRPSTHRHRVIGREIGFSMRPGHKRQGIYHVNRVGPIVTLVWHSTFKQHWGFWVPSGWLTFKKVPWREYIYGEKAV